MSCLLIIVTFLYFINLNNSFKFMNYKLNNKTYMRMGCDYYIEQNLYIYYNDNKCNYINLYRDDAYYTDLYYDEDFNLDIPNDNSYMLHLKKVKEYHLVAKKSPILIYSNYTIIDTYLLNKYKRKLEFKMKNDGYKTWNDIDKIVILEERYERL